MAKKLEPVPENKAVTTSTVWIGCRLTSGIILDVRELVDVEYNGKTIQQYADIKERRVLRGIGNFTLPNKDRKWQPAQSLRLTDGNATLTLLDKDFWETALRQNAALQQLVKKNLVYVAASKDAAIEMADELSEVKTGFEKFQFEKDPAFKTIKPRNDKDEIPIPDGK
jgi:hypothetical protein